MISSRLNLKLSANDFAINYSNTSNVNNEIQTITSSTEPKFEWKIKSKNNVDKGGDLTFKNPYYSPCP
jgi:hypothetical protein